MGALEKDIVSKELSGQAKPQLPAVKRAGKAIRTSKRYAEIVHTVVKHGFGHILAPEVLKLVKARSEAQETATQEGRAKRLRSMFEELGTTFVKLGQLLATRPDLVPKEYILELSNLKDSAAPMKEEEVQSIIEEELGGKVPEIFKSFDASPIGCASVGQVHKAVLMSGETVAVKVQRPGVANLIMQDMEIIEDLASTLGHRSPLSEAIDLVEFAEEIRRALLREVDYTLEARSIQRFFEDFKDDHEVHIPTVFWEQTTQRVLTMEFLKGVPLSKPDKLAKMHFDKKRAGELLARSMGKMVFVHGHFHGDPHEGNLMAMPDGGIGLLDFGSVGYLDRRTKTKVRLLYAALATKDAATTAAVIVDICSPQSEVNISNLEQDIDEFIAATDLTSGGNKIEQGLNLRLTMIMLKHNLAPPSYFVLMERSLAEMEGVLLGLGIDLDVSDIMKRCVWDIARKVAKESISPAAMLRTSSEYREFIRTAPGKANRLMDKLDRGELAFRMETQFMNELKKEIWKAVFLLMAGVFVMLVIFLVLFKFL